VSIEPTYLTITLYFPSFTLYTLLKTDFVDMSIDVHAKSPVAPVAKRIPSYMLPKKKSSPQKQTRQPTPETQVVKSKPVKGNAGAASKESHTSMVDDAQIESKIEVTPSNVSILNILTIGVMLMICSLQMRSRMM